MKPIEVMVCVWVVLNVSCTSEYDFPDQVPLTGRQWVDAPLQRDIDRHKEELARAFEASYPTLQSLACSDANDHSSERAYEQARHMTWFAIQKARDVTAEGQTVEAIAAAISSRAHELAPSNAELFLCREDPVPSACVIAAAKEAADTLYAMQGSRTFPSRQGDLLDLFAREYAYDVGVVQAAGTLFDSREAILAACEDSPFVITARRVTGERPERPGDDLAQIVSGIAGGEPMVCSYTGAWFESATRSFNTALEKQVAVSLSAGSRSGCAGGK